VTQHHELPVRIELIARIRYHSAAYVNLLQRNNAFQIQDHNDLYFTIWYGAYEVDRQGGAAM
jgi:hypothetical protein